MTQEQNEQLMQILEAAQIPTESLQKCFNDIVSLFSIPSAEGLITPEEYLAQTGEAWPDDAAVYVKWYNPATGYPNPGEWWDPSAYGPIKNDRNVHSILVANCNNVPAPSYIPSKG